LKTPRYIFGHTSESLGMVSWYWKNDKANVWKTYKPRLQDVGILDKLSKEDKRRAQKEIYEDIMGREYPKKVAQPVVRSRFRA
tara:strand:+ start:381 stop:629 length:249 start_codon:yes stop_codon:yes gene_type:complete